MACNYVYYHSWISITNSSTYATSCRPALDFAYAYRPYNNKYLYSQRSRVSRFFQLNSSLLLINAFWFLKVRLKACKARFPLRELTGDRFPLPVNTGRQLGVVETGLKSVRAACIISFGPPHPLTLRLSLVLVDPLCSLIRSILVKVVDIW